MVNKDEVLRQFYDHFRVKSGASYSGKVNVADDGKVSVEGHVFFVSAWPLGRLPVSFDRVDGDFSANDKNLLDMAGFPTWVGGDLEAQGNQFHTLEYLPRHIGRLCVISSNQLESLDGSPEHTNASFNCRQNNLETLEGGPKTVNGDFRCDGNKLTNLIGAPTKVTGFLTCTHNSLTSLEGIPTELGGIELEYERELPLLRLLYAKHIDFYYGGRSARAVKEILMKYAGQGRAGAIDCKRELVAAGFEDNAKW